MSRQASLPPRCPFQKKAIPHQIQEFISPNPQKNTGFTPRHHKSSSQSSILDDQPAWLDDLLTETDLNSTGMSHRRSASDSVTFLDRFVPLSSLMPCKHENSIFNGNNCNGLGNDCIYGPNSPRRKGDMHFSENAIVSALSEHISHNQLQYIDGSVCISGCTLSDSNNDCCDTSDDLNPETKAVKRYSGQRSRVRKLQYIAELEKTVNCLQTLEADLAVRVASLLQQRVTLSMENSKLKQQVATLQQEKLILDGEYQSLRREIERLKTNLANSPRSKVTTDIGKDRAAGVVSSEATWQMLDMEKLNLKENTITLNHGFRI